MIKTWNSQFAHSHSKVREKKSNSKKCQFSQIPRVDPSRSTQTILSASWTKSDVILTTKMCSNVFFNSVPPEIRQGPVSTTYSLLRPYHRPLFPGYRSLFFCMKILCILDLFKVSQTSCHKSFLQHWKQPPVFAVL